MDAHGYQLSSTQPNPSEGHSHSSLTSALSTDNTQSQKPETAEDRDKARVHKHLLSLTQERTRPPTTFTAGDEQSPNTRLKAAVHAKAAATRAEKFPRSCIRTTRI